MFKFGVLISGSGTNLQAILDACDIGLIPGKVLVVGSDKTDAYGLERARAKGIPTFVVDYKDISKNFKNKSGKYSLPKDYSLQEFMVANPPEGRGPSDIYLKRDYFVPRSIAESLLLKELAPYQLDLLVFAGFMRVVTKYFINRFSPNPMKPKIMNIHPALLPAFPGTDGYGDTFNYGCKIGGCTVHFVDGGEDTGPIIGQRAYEILETDTLETIKKKGVKLEWELYPKCIKLFTEGRLKVITNEKGRKIVKILAEK